MRIKKEYLDKAKKQFCKDYYCRLSDFEKNENTITYYGDTISRQYPSEKPIFRMMCFYNKIFITTEDKLYHWAREKFENAFSGWAFSFHSLRKIDNKLREFGHEIKDMHHYYLPLEDFPQPEHKFDLKWFDQEEIESFRHRNRFTDALAFHPRYPDVIAVAAMKDEDIMGIAGASEDGDELWQIGINVLPQYRVNGMAVNLVTHLKEEIMNRGKVPFYGTVESHNLSKSVAIKSGFFPVWSEIYSGPIE